jgi:hypothetical protein
MKLMTKNLDWLAEIPSGWADAVLRDMKGFFSTRCDEHADGHAPAAAKPIAASFRIFGGKIYQTDR